MKKNIVNISVFIISVFLLKYTFVFGIVTAILILIFYSKIDPNSNFTEYLHNIAFSIDLLGNVMLGPLLNLIAIKFNGYKFGDRHRTISYALAVNKRDKTLILFGKFLVWAINIADISQEDHFDKALKLNNWEIVVKD